MAGKDLVTQITSDNLEGILMGGTPALVACIRRDRDYQDHLQLLGDVAAPAGSRLNVCVALDDLLPYFSYVYDLKGTPTFLLMHQGMVLDEILGKTSLKILMEFARVPLSALKGMHMDGNLPPHQETGIEPDDKLAVKEPSGTRAKSHDHSTHTTNKIRGRKRCLKI